MVQLYRIRRETDALGADEIHAWENLIEVSNNDVDEDRRVVVFAICNCDGCHMLNDI